MKQWISAYVGDVHVEIDVFELVEKLEASDQEKIYLYLNGLFGAKLTSDPVERLELITQLRKEGYTVEPA